MIKRTLMALMACVLTILPALAQPKWVKMTENLQKGYNEMMDGNAHEAYGILVESLKDSVPDDYPFGWLCKCLTLMREYELAEQAAEFAMQTLPQDDNESRASVFNDLAQMVCAGSYVAEAIEFQSEAVKLVPNSNNYSLLAYYYSLDHDFDKARENLTKAMTLPSAPSGALRALEAYEVANATRAASFAARRIFLRDRDKSLMRQVKERVAMVPESGGSSPMIASLYKILGVESLLLDLYIGEEKADLGPAVSFLHDSDVSEDYKSYFMDNVCRDRKLSAALAEPLSYSFQDVDNYYRLLVAGGRYLDVAALLVKLHFWDIEDLKEFDSASLHDCMFKGGGFRALADLLDSERRASEDTVSGYLAIAGFLYNNGYFDEALRDLDRYLAVNPQSAEAHNIKGNIFLRQKKLDKAERELLQAEKLLNGYGLYYVKNSMDLAMLYAARGGARRDSVESWCRKTLERDDYQGTFHDMAAAYLGDPSLMDEKALNVLCGQGDMTSYAFCMAIRASIKKNKAETLKYLRLFVEECNWSMGPGQLQVHPCFWWLKNDPSFKALMADFAKKIKDAEAKWAELLSPKKESE